MYPKKIEFLILDEDKTSLKIVDIFIVLSVLFLCVILGFFALIHLKVNYQKASNLSLKNILNTVPIYVN